MDAIKAARKGKLPAFLGLFDEHHAVLFRFAYRLTRSVADAEDVVQDCFLGLLRPGCGYDPAKTSVRVYLLGAVRNQAYKRLQRREEAGVGAEPATLCSPESEAARSQMETLVERAVAELPETQREVGIEVGAVKSRLQRARAALKESLAAYAPGQ